MLPNFILILKLILILALTLYILRVIYGFLTRSKESSSLQGRSIDEIIATKKAYLLGSQSLPPTDTLGGNSIRSYVTKNLIDPHAVQISGLIKEASWGEGALLKRTGEKFNKKTGIETGQCFVTVAINELSKREYTPSLTFDDFENRALNLALFTQLIVKQPDILSALSFKFKVSEESIIKATSSFLFESEGVELDRALKFAQNSTPLPKNLDYFKAIYLSPTIDILLEKIKRRARLIKFLHPLPTPAMKVDLDWARAILEVREGDSLYQIKKRFKEMALRAHPDKLSEIKSKELITIANNNFSLIKKAYEMLKESGEKQ